LLSFRGPIPALLSHRRTGAAPSGARRPAELLLRFCPSFPACSSRPSKADTLASRVFVNEFNSGSFKRLPNGRLVCSRNWNFAVNDLNPADRGYADFGDAS
jgi:hypothetical protein